MSAETVTYFPNVLKHEPRMTSVESRSHLCSENGVRRERGGESSAEHSPPINAPTELNPSDELLLERFRHEDREALGRIRKRDTQALAILFGRYARLVKTIARRILRDEAEADELVQEVFLFVFRKAALFDPTLGTARSWIVQIAYHRAIDRRRQLVSRHFYDAVNLEAPAAADVHTEVAFYEQSLEGQLGKDTLVRMRESLSEHQRRTLDLYFFEGYTIEEIAQEMGQSPGNIRHHYYRALEKMRRLAFPARLASK